MIIESSTFRVKDDYGIIIEVKPIKSTLTDEASNEIANFFKKYRIINAYKEINPTDKRKLELGTPTKETQEKSQETKRARPAERLPMKEMVYIVKKLLPPEFGMNDFVDYMNSKEEYNGYTSEDKKEMWKSVYAHLLRNKKVKLVNEGEQKSKYKYRYIGIDKPEDDVKLKIDAFKNGETVKL